MSRFEFVELTEKQLRQVSDAQAVWANLRAARVEAAKDAGSMRWKSVDGRDYLVRVSTKGAEKGFGVRSAATEEIFTKFWARKEAAEARLAAMLERADEQRQLNRAYRVGRTPAIVVRVLAAIDDAGMYDQFLSVGTHAIYAYETAAGVRVQADAMATLDLDLLFDMNKMHAYATSLKRSDARSLVGILRKADKTFRVKRDQLQTAVNDDSFEVDIIRRQAKHDDPHPLRMSDDEDDFWAVQISQGDQLASSRKFEQVVIASNGEMALMRTVHPLDFVRLKRTLSQLPSRDLLKKRKDALQAEAVQELWDRYLHLREEPIDAGVGAQIALERPRGG